MEYLASQAGVIAVYVDDGTGKELAPGEWRGDDPLSALGVFAGASSSAVVTPAPGFWIIGIPSMLEGSAVTLFSQLLDPAAPPGWSADELHELEFALFQQLPVRGGGSARGVRQLGLAYHWLGGEEPDALLVVSSENVGGMASKYTFFRAFKVHVSRVGGRIEVSCLWSSEEIAGPLVGDIQRDFDGDGIQDLVFDRYEQVEGSPIILSGRDGHPLLRFEGAEVAIERVGKGPTRISALEPKESDPTTWEARVLRFDALLGRFVRISQQAVTPEVHSPQQLPAQPRSGLLDLLALEVGGKDKVTMARVHREHPTQMVQVTAREKQRGFAGRVLLEYKSPTYLAEEKKK
ncbi:MAG TPA: hypothetical protein VMK12_19810 [Anaeromyxobacteraceae bacterium]|nr:hypothetical protein [Anaeromyxobacteraceae bacterium]